jgi:hypothetical protein
MTKRVTSVATMMPADERKLDLIAPVYRNSRTCEWLLKRAVRLPAKVS